MKKNILFGILLLSVSWLLMGFDSSETAESVLEKSEEAMQGVQDLSAGLDLDLDADFEIGDGTITSDISLLLNAEFTMDMTLDPFALRLEGTYDFSALGTGEPGLVRIYVVPDGEDMMIYLYYQEDTSEDADDSSGTWFYSKDDTTNWTGGILTDGTLTTGSSGGNALGYTLTPEAVEYNGCECYELSTTLDASTLTDLLDIEDNETVSLVLSFLDGIRLTLDYYVDTATCQPAGFHMDLDDSDLTSLNALLQTFLSGFDSEDAETSAALILNKSSLDLPITCGDVNPISVPQEALDAVESGEAEYLDDSDDAENETEDAIDEDIEELIEDYTGEEGGDTAEAA